MEVVLSHTASRAVRGAREGLSQQAHIDTKPQEGEGFLFSHNLIEILWSISLKKYSKGL